MTAAAPAAWADVGGAWCLIDSDPGAAPTQTAQRRRQATARVLTRDAHAGPERCAD